MKRIILALVFLLSVLPLAVQPARAQAAHMQEGKTGEPYTGRSVCLPDAFPDQPTDCLPLGPSQTLADLSKQGLSYPPRPLPASTPSRELTNSPVFIAKLNLENNEPGNVYATLDDAVAKNNPVRQIAAGAGLRYVSFINEVKVNGKAFVQLKSGEWMRASPAGYSYFQGMQFRKTPSTSFGWMVDHAKAHSAPSWNAPEVGETILRETVIQIYAITEAEGMQWFMIGPDRWVPWQDARQVRIDTNPPKGVTGDRWISVNLYDQTLAVYDHRQLVFATLIASGAEPYYTRPGLFQIQKKLPLETMQGAFNADRSDFYYLEDVPWTMYYDEARALHGAYWRAWYGYPGTHGCVNLSLGDSNWLFHWANEGDWVYVWDPSGMTPTDPSLYGEGGA
jgi:hypothetical protein